MSAASPRSLRLRSHGGRARSVMVAVAAMFSGCRPGPDVTVAGSYFPSWMVALVLGVLGTIVCWQVFTRIGIEPYLGPRMLVYASLVLLITLVLSLSVFRG